MFLNILNNQEKEIFLELAHHIARSDNDFSNEQKSIIETYCIEMTIEDIEYNKDLFNLETLLAKVKEKESQKIILLEIMALVYSGNYLHIEEKKVINKMIDIFGLNPSLAIVYGEWAKSILALSIQGQALIKL